MAKNKRQEIPASTFALRLVLVQSRKVYKSLRRSRVAHFLLLWLAPCLVLESFFFAYLLKQPDNIEETFPAQLIFPALMHAFTALVIAAIIFFLKRPKRIGPQMITVTLLGLFLSNYNDRLSAAVSVIRTFTPILPQSENDMPFISLVFLIVLFALAIMLGKWIETKQTKIPNLSNANLVMAVIIIPGIMFTSQVVRLGGILPTMIRETSFKVIPPNAKSNGRATDKPDIYYIVLDRYTSNSVLKQQFGYDNSSFLNSLREKGFSIDDNAMSNYPYTASSISSFLNMNYHGQYTDPFKNNKLQATALFHNISYHGSAIQLLKQQGYYYVNLGSLYGTSNNAPLAQLDLAKAYSVKIFGKTKVLRGVESFQFEQSVYNQFAQFTKYRWPLKVTNITWVPLIQNQIDTLDSLANDKHQGGRLIFAHLLVPHDPFFFNGDGSLSQTTTVDNIGKPIKQKYIGQIEFINTYMKKIISDIQTNSRNQAVIMLMSDEGPYPSLMNQTFSATDPALLDHSDAGIDSDMSKWADLDLQMKFGTLQALYIPKATPEDLAHAAPVNMFRIVLNRYLGYNLDYLPICHIALNSGKHNLYNFTDITYRFGPPNPECAKFE